MHMHAHMHAHACTHTHLITGRHNHIHTHTHTLSHTHTHTHAHSRTCTDSLHTDTHTFLSTLSDTHTSVYSRAKCCIRKKNRYETSTAERARAQLLYLTQTCGHWVFRTRKDNLVLWLPNKRDQKTPFFATICPTPPSHCLGLRRDRKIRKQGLESS